MVINVFILLILLFIFSYFLSFFWSFILAGKKYWLILAPGIIVHELSHAIACVLTFAKIKKIKLLSLRGGYVKHQKPKIPILGDFLISIAPIIGGLGALFLLSKSFGFYDLGSNIVFGLYQKKDLFVFGQEVFSFVLKEWLSLKFWLFAYFSISIIICLIPSKQDLKNSFWSSFFLFSLLFFFLYFGLFLESIDVFLNYIFIVILLGIFWAILAVVITLPIFAILKIIKGF